MNLMLTELEACGPVIPTVSLLWMQTCALNLKAQQTSEEQLEGQQCCKILRDQRGRGENKGMFAWCRGRDG